MKTGRVYDTEWGVVIVLHLDTVNCLATVLYRDGAVAQWCVNTCCFPRCEELL